MSSRWFSNFASYLSTMTGRPGTFVIAVSLVIVWAVTGPFFHYSDTWQLVINTSTTIVTFLMVFLIQNTQNRDTAAMQIKLDELIRAIEGAHNALLDLEELEEKDLTRFRKQYENLARDARVALRKGGSDTDSPFVDNRGMSDEKRRDDDRHDDHDDDKRDKRDTQNKPNPHERKN